MSSMLSLISPEQNKTGGGQGTLLRRDISQIAESSVKRNWELYLPVNIPRIVSEALPDELAVWSFDCARLSQGGQNISKARISAYFLRAENISLITFWTDLERSGGYYASYRKTRTTEGCQSRPRQAASRDRFLVNFCRLHE